MGYTFILHKSFYFVIFDIKMIGHVNPGFFQTGVKRSGQKLTANLGLALRLRIHGVLNHLHSTIRLHGVELNSIQAGLQD
jgi:hypothetical protein